MIGDGMGTSHVFAGLTANGGHLFLDNFKHVGFSKTQSSDKYITDSAAGGTALSTGQKTYNGAIGVNTDTVAIKTILEMAEEKGLATGLVFHIGYHSCHASLVHRPSGKPRQLRGYCCRLSENRYRCIYWRRIQTFCRAQRQTRPDRAN